MESIRTLQWVDAAPSPVTFGTSFAAALGAAHQSVPATHALVKPFGTRPGYTVNAPSSAPPPG